MVIQQSLRALTHHTHCRQLHKICMSSFSKSTTVSSFQSWLVTPWVARPRLHTSSKWQQCQPNHTCRNRYATSRLTSKDNCHAHGHEGVLFGPWPYRQGFFAVLHSVSHLLAMQLHRLVRHEICSPLFVLQLLDPMSMCLIRSLQVSLSTKQLGLLDPVAMPTHLIKHALSLAGLDTGF